MGFTGSMRWEHVLADGLLLGVGWAGPVGRRFLAGGLPLWLAGIVLDSQRYLPAMSRTIHTGDLWELERRLFPAQLDGTIGIWPAYFAAHPVAALDLVCGAGYIAYLPEFFAVVLFLFLVKSPRFERMAWAFFAVNALVVAIVQLYPAAPPWYVLAHGPGPADPAAPASAAGAARFDALLGITYFSQFYARNPNVFGAMPSLHVAYTLLVSWYTWDRGLRWRIGTGLFAGFVGFCAVYLTHHYLLDVVMAVPVTLAACAGVHALAARIPLREPAYAVSAGGARA